MSTSSNSKESGAVAGRRKSLKGTVVPFPKRSATHPTTALEQGDLIEDREVTDLDQDRLHHGDIADQLGSLVGHVSTPANVALYGPWGSGKSGIANLLRERLKADEGTRFARFDAFKYAENPLRRNFVSAVATELGISDREFHDDLYSGKTRTDLTLPKGSAWKIGGIFVGAAIAMFGLVFAWALAAAAFGPGKFMDDVWAKLPSSVSAGFIPASVIAALVAIAGRSLVVDRKTDRAESDEQFEGLLRALVQKSGAKKVVIFVDELDRCAPKDVVATLDAVRTFLGVRGCVFIVAADQQVLEEALTRSVEQATPTDKVNPYYSAGSAYLDKVFQYQISIPPLLTSSVTNFASAIVKTRKTGLWTIVDVDRVIPVLIPSHVRSPRRVKALLNAFAMTYRLAETRRRDGLLEGDLPPRAAEIARLVCFQVEFPLFARDLTAVPDLPRLVVRKLADPSAGQESRTSDEAHQLACKYANHSADVARLLVDEDEDASSSDAKEVRTAHGKQLTAYLTRTRTIEGPGRDLIFMQTTASVFNLPADLADDVMRHAEDGNAEPLTKPLSRLNTTDQEAVTNLLIQQVHSQAGLLADNYATTLLTLASAGVLSITGRENAVADAIYPLLPNDSLLGETTLAGAWAAAAHGSGESARGLGKMVLSAPALYEHSDLAFAVLRDAKSALAADSTEAVSLFTAYLVSDECAKTVEALKGMDAENLELLLGAGAESCGVALKEAIAKSEAEAAAAAAAVAAPATAASRAAAAAAASTATDSDEAATDPAEVIGSLSDLLTSVPAESRQAKEAIVRILLQGDTQECRTAVEDHLGLVAPVSDKETVERFLEAAKRRITALWPQWLDAIDDVAAQHIDVGTLNELAEKLWSNSEPKEDEPDRQAHVDAAARAMARLNRHRSSDAGGKATGLVLGALEGFAQDEAETRSRRLVLARAATFVAHGLANGHEVAANEIEAIRQTVTLDAVGAEDVTSAYIVEVLPDMVSLLAADWTSDCTEMVATLLESITQSGWLDRAGKVRAKLRALNLIPEQERALFAVHLPDPSDVKVVARTGGTTFDADLTSWIRLAQPAPADLIAATRLALSRSNKELAAAISEQRQTYSVTEQAWLLEQALDEANGKMSGVMETACGLQELPDATVSALLAKRYKTATTNTERIAVLALWQTADIRSDAARRDLFEQVLIPMLRLNENGANKQAATEALRRTPDLAKPHLPRNTSQQLQSALKEACAHPDDVQKRAVEVAKAVGFKTGAKGFFDRRPEIKSD